MRRLTRQPSILAAEIAWRWCYALSALLLVGWSLAAFLETIPVTEIDLMALSSRFPLFVTWAIQDMFHGSGPAMLRAIVADAAGLVALWLVFATVGRWSVMRALLPGARIAWQPLLQLNLLRAALGSVAVLAYLGALFFSGAVSEAPTPRPGLFFAIFVALWFAIGAAWSAVSWYLQLAPLYAQEAATAWQTIYAAVELARQRATQLGGIGLLLGGARLVLGLAFFFGFFSVLGDALHHSAGAFMVRMAAFTMLYSAVFSVLRLVRLAAFAEVA